jgi:hypothetical protein
MQNEEVVPLRLHIRTFQILEYRTGSDEMWY